MMTKMMTMTSLPCTVCQISFSANYSYAPCPKKVDHMAVTIQNLNRARKFFHARKNTVKFRVNSRTNWRLNSLCNGDRVFKIG